jgi:hypothetical protein
MSTTAEDRDEILELLYRYCHTIDSHQCEEWVSLFTSDGVYEGREGRITAGSERLAKLVASTKGMVMRHVAANPLIEVTGDTARVHSYEMVLKGTTIASTGSHEDELVRTPDGWRFARRKFVRDEQPA